ncbi:MAG: hypothetical protein LBB75_02445 [Oscillospiraceae bacterium]|jgi:hypothetical protein|nr:hypothetical protein [Oscillospiraceae bacterium]
MYPDLYNTGGAQFPPMYPPAGPGGFAVPPMWMQMPPGFSPMPSPGPANCPGGDCGAAQQPPGGAQPGQNAGFPPAQNYPFPGFGPPPPPNFSGFYPWQ